MSFELTERTRLSFESGNVTPQLILKIEGIDTLFGAQKISEFIRYSDSLQYGDAGLVYGGKTEIENQKDLLTLSKGTSTKITQILNSDKGQGSSVSGMRVSLVDFNGEATKLITPGEVVPELLGLKAKILYGPKDGNYPEDFYTIFRGILDGISSGAGFVTLDISHPDQKRRTEIFNKVSAELNGGIDSVQTTILLDDASNFLVPIQGPDLSFDTANEFFVRIEDEIIKYTGVSGNNLTGVVRGSLGTTAAAHSSGAGVESIIKLEENAVDLALKIMLSGWEGYFKEDVQITNFNVISPSLNIADSVFFSGFSLFEEYGLTVGDYFTTSGASNGANNVSLFQITEIQDVFDNEGYLLGSYLVSSGAGFVDEIDSTGLISFRSRYDVLSDGAKLAPDEVDVLGYLNIKDLFLAAFEYQFVLAEEIKVKEFIDKEILLPASSFSIPRKAKNSIGTHSAPLPGEPIKTLNTQNVLNPSQLSVLRTTNKNFYNAVIYKFDQDVIKDRFLKGVTYFSAESFERIGRGQKSLVIESLGLKTSLSGVNNSNIAAARLLKKYRYAAESVRGVKIDFATGANLEIGDIVILDLNTLQMSDIKNGSRSGESRLMLVDNLEFDFKGLITLDLIDTSFDQDQRRGLVGPASFVKSGISQTQFIIKPHLSSGRFFDNEFKKWEPYLGCGVRVHNLDYTFDFSTTLTGLSGNLVTVADPLGFIPDEDYIFELSKYNNQTDDIILRYVFITDNATFDDGKTQFKLF